MKNFKYVETAPTTRTKAISKDEILNLVIALNTSRDVSEFLKQI